jgi:predicted ABC-type ATPase
VNNPKIVIIAGPNGAGKTTFARAFLPQEAQCLRFINADLIAAGLSPFAPEAAAMKAGRLMLQEMDGCVAARESFAFETTLAGRVYLRHIKNWRQWGYHVSLFFLKLPSADAAIERVAARVRQGGHFIPDEVIKRRFELGWRNFESHYKNVVDDWTVYDSHHDEPILMEWSQNT